VLELSSFQLERTFSLAPVAALILNLSSDHLDRYSSEQDYQIAKERVYRNAEIAILNRDAVTFNLPESIHKSISFGLDESSTDFGVLTVDGKRFLSFAGEPLLANDALPLIGEHNVSNALAVLACSNAIGVKPVAALDGLIGFKGLPHRTQLVDTIEGVRYINDSKATNAGATLAAVHGDLDNIILIAGGDAKNAELGALAEALKGKLKASILLGKDADKLETLLTPIASCIRVDSIEQAVMQAHELASSGDTVLLSPACSSLDMFKNYIERGERFVAAVTSLAKNSEVQA
jgi:UDP-N-acetylmuramoylalanine--D-glutamate ligase